MTVFTVVTNALVSRVDQGVPGESPYAEQQRRTPETSGARIQLVGCLSEDNLTGGGSGRLAGATACCGSGPGDEAGGRPGEEDRAETGNTFQASPAGIWLARHAA